MGVDFKSLCKKYVGRDVNFVNVVFSKEDNAYIVSPSYEDNICNQLDDTFKRILILDEHGKLAAAVVDDGIKSTEVKFDVNQKNDIERFIYNTPQYLVEDHKLKKAIDRYIHIIEHYGATPVKNKHGSTNLNHLLWMLYEIRSQKRPLLIRRDWLGYIQSALVTKNIIVIDHEQDVLKNIL